ncbi:MAG: hypothetical protein ACRDSP_15370 [Pseudonocardiaceae bacterium]
MTIPAGVPARRTTATSHPHRVRRASPADADLVGDCGEAVLQISTDPRTLHPDQRKLPFEELAEADAIYGYSFILTNRDTSTPNKATAIEYCWLHQLLAPPSTTGLDLSACLHHDCDHLC